MLMVIGEHMTLLAPAEHPLMLATWVSARMCMSVGLQVGAGTSGPHAQAASCLSMGNVPSSNPEEEALPVPRVAPELQHSRVYALVPD